MNMKKDVLRDSLESIMFQEENLKPVIKVLTMLISDKTVSKKAIEALIRARYQLLEDILRFFSFHIGHKIELQKLDKFTNSSDHLKLEQELKEKNAFLEEIAQKLEDIYKNLANE